MSFLFLSYSLSIFSYLINSDIKVIYVRGTNVYDIEGIFLDECKNVHNGLSADGKEESKVGDNYTSLEVYDIEGYYYIVCVDNTYIYSQT